MSLFRSVPGAASTFPPVCKHLPSEAWLTAHFCRWTVNNNLQILSPDLWVTIHRGFHGSNARLLNPDVASSCILLTQRTKRWERYKYPASNKFTLHCCCRNKTTLPFNWSPGLFSGEWIFGFTGHESSCSKSITSLQFHLWTMNISIHT